MRKDNITTLYQTGLLSEIDIHFARFISHLSNNDDPDIFLGSALVSSTTRSGDVCLDLASFAENVLLEKQNGNDPIVCPKLSIWKQKLSSISVVGNPGDICPLILDNKNRLYLYRYWDYEKKLTDSIKYRVKEDINEINLPLLRDSLARLFPKTDVNEINWHKIASLAATLNNFCVISGGPGAGKTTTIATILALLLEQVREGKLRIFLAAPTGKAAARLIQSINNAKENLNCNKDIKASIPSESYTIHRMLKTVHDTPYFRYNSENPLPADVVVVDEASMVDLALMSKLIQAVPAGCKLILVGDKDQLASVEAGSVFGDICGRDNVNRFSEDFHKKVVKSTGEELDIQTGQKINKTGLHDCIVFLKNSYRFAESSEIGELSQAVNLGDTDKVLSLLKKTDNNNIKWGKILSLNEMLKTLRKNIIEGYKDYLKIEDPCRAFELFNRFKIFCAVRIGPFGVDALNRFAEQVLRREGLINFDYSSHNPWYRGRPVLITRNDYNLGLFNGDMGITMPDPMSDNNDLYVFFPETSGELKRFLPHRLPEHETVYAMTIHKSQGSEFENVHLVLPDKDYPILTKELIYTGVTRAEKSVTIWGSEDVLRASISRKIERSSGLRDALWRDL